MSILYGGVNYSIPGDGGPHCYTYIPMWQRVLETIIFVPVALAAACAAYQRLDMPAHFVERLISSRQHLARRYVLGFACVVFGTEIGYKMATRTVIYLLNPCHMTTFMQIYLLLSDPTGWMTCWIFRMHMYAACGASLAIAFPVVNTRLLPYEVFTYYVQHLLILLAPMYLVTFKGAFSAEPLNDVTWPILSCAVILLYHYIPLQVLGLITKVNLNNMLCPAISDPFRGPYWRPITVCHQVLFIPLHGKLYGILSRNLLILLQPYRTNQEPTPLASPVKEGDDYNISFSNNHPIKNGTCTKDDNLKFD